MRQEVTRKLKGSMRFVCKCRKALAFLYAVLDEYKIGLLEI